MKFYRPLDWPKLAEGFFFFWTVLGAFAYSLGDIAELLPPKWKPWIAGFGLVLTTLTKFYRAVPHFPGNITEEVMVPPTKKKKRKS